MKPRLYLHLGPPKTATTSLQIALEELRSDVLYYGGTFQPRERNVGSLAYRLHEAAVHTKLSDGHGGSVIFDEVNNHFSSGRSVMISEEEFLVEKTDCPIVKKIEHLSGLVSNIPVTVLLGLRDPEDGIPSLYQQLFQRLPLSEQYSFARFCRGPRGRCFDYGYLRKILSLNGFGDIRALGFEAITTGKLDISRLVSQQRHMLDALRIGRSNVSDDADGERVMPSVSARALGRNEAVRVMIKYTGIRDSCVYRRIVSALDRLTLTPSGPRDLRLPDNLASRLRTEYLAAYRELPKV